jgi:AraC family transcriptional regulator
MVNINQSSDRWYGFDARPAILLKSPRPEWGAEFQTVWHGPGGSHDRESSVLHVAAILNPTRHRLGPPEKPFLLSEVSAAVVVPGERMYGAWQGAVRAHDLFISSSLVEATLARPLRAQDIEPRHFAHSRSPDATDHIIRSLLEALKSDLLAGRPSGLIFAQTVVAALLHHLVRPAPAFEPASPRPSGLSRQQLSMIDELIDTHLGGRISLIDFAGRLGVSVRHFCRAFRASKGLSPHQYVIRRRVERARSLIEAGDLTYPEAAEMAGFADHSQMTKTFRRVLGVTPSHFRNRSE